MIDQELSDTEEFKKVWRKYWDLSKVDKDEMLKSQELLFLDR